MGTIVWLASEVMFFAGLFAMYFTLRSTAPELWAEESAKLNVPLALANTIVLVLSSVTCQFGVFAAERLQPRRAGGIFQVTRWGMVEWFALTFIMGRAFIAKRFGHFEATSAIVVSYYWHFVDVVWIVLFLVVYFLR